MAVAWACPECHRSVDLFHGVELAPHYRLGTVKPCKGSGKRIPELDK